MADEAPIPTKENPVLTIRNSLQVARGYLAVTGGGDVRFVASFDGPLLRVKSRDQSLLLGLEISGDLATALGLALMQPVAEPGTHTEELAKMGYTALSVDTSSPAPELRADEDKEPELGEGDGT